MVERVVHWKQKQKQKQKRLPPFFFHIHTHTQHFSVFFSTNFPPIAAIVVPWTPYGNIRFLQSIGFAV